MIFLMILFIGVLWWFGMTPQTIDLNYYFLGLCILFTGVCFYAGTNGGKK